MISYISFIEVSSALDSIPLLVGKEAEDLIKYQEEICNVSNL